MEQDAKILNEDDLMTRLEGDRDLARRLIQVFLGEAPKNFAELEAKLGEDDQVESRRLAHSLKGAAASVAGMRMKEVAYAMENLAREGRLGDVKSRLPELKAEFERLKKELERFTAS